MIGSYVEAARHWGSQQKAAAALGIPRTTFRRKYHEESRKVVFKDIEDGKRGFLPGMVQRLTRPESKRRCVVFLPDLHAPYEDRRALDVALNHVFAKHSPTDLMLGGDAADLFEFSRFASTPRMQPDEEVNAVVFRLEQLRDTFKDCKRWYLMGNHERRIIRYIQNEAPKLARILGATIPAIFQLERLGYHFHDNSESWESRGEFLKIGKLNYLHGDEIGGTGYKYAAQRMAEIYRANIIFGHLHVTDSSKPMRDLESRVIRTWGVGCLHTRTPGYRPGASHNIGFAVVEYDAGESGHFTVYNYLLDDNYSVRM